TMDLEPAQVITGQADSPAFPGVVSLPQLNSASTANEWQFTEAAGVAPAGTIHARLLAILVDETPSTGYLDDLAASVTVPEPSAIALVAVTLTGAICFRRRCSRRLWSAHWKSLF